MAQSTGFKEGLPDNTDNESLAAEGLELSQVAGAETQLFLRICFPHYFCNKTSDLEFDELTSP